MNSNRKIVLFLIKATLLYILWFIIYDLWLVKVGWFDAFIIKNIMWFSEHVLKGFNYSLFVYDQTMGIDGSHGVFIGVPCNGVELMALFLGFIILFPGKIVHKLWFSTVGLFVIHVLNIVRVSSLILIAYYHPNWIDFNHKYTFTILLYVVVFLGWMIWITKFSTITNKSAS